MVSNNIPLSTLAGLDDKQLCWIYFRPRGKDGSLIRKDGSFRKELPSPNSDVSRSPSFQTTDFRTMFFQVCRYRNMSNKEAKKEWKRYLQKNPKLAQRYKEYHGE